MAAHTGRTWHGQSVTSMLAVTAAGMWTLRPAACTSTAPLASSLLKVMHQETMKYYQSAGKVLAKSKEFQSA